MTTEDDGVTLDILATMIKAGFDDVEKRFDDVDKRFEGVQSELTHLNEKIDAVDASLRVEIGALKQEVRVGFLSVNHRLAGIGDKLEDHEKRITRIERELAP
jgi:tetrahydromethanopterin S-methyltransferase subunit G